LGTGGKVVEHSAHNPKIKGSNPVFLCSGRELNGGRRQTADPRPNPLHQRAGRPERGPGPGLSPHTGIIDLRLVVGS
jgi:hypothetical protein